MDLAIFLDDVGKNPKKMRYRTSNHLSSPLRYGGLLFLITCQVFGRRSPEEMDFAIKASKQDLPKCPSPRLIHENVMKENLVGNVKEAKGTLSLGLCVSNVLAASLGQKRVDLMNGSVDELMGVAWTAARAMEDLVAEVGNSSDRFVVREGCPNFQRMDIFDSYIVAGNIVTTWDHLLMLKDMWTSVCDMCCFVSMSNGNDQGSIQQDLYSNFPKFFKVIWDDMIRLGEDYYPMLKALQSLGLSEVMKKNELFLTGASLLDEGLKKYPLSKTLVYIKSLSSLGQYKLIIQLVSVSKSFGFVTIDEPRSADHHMKMIHKPNIDDDQTCRWLGGSFKRMFIRDYQMKHGKLPPISDCNEEVIDFLTKGKGRPSNESFNSVHFSSIRKDIGSHHPLDFIKDKAIIPSRDYWTREFSAQAYSEKYGQRISRGDIQESGRVLIGELNNDNPRNGIDLLRMRCSSGVPEELKVIVGCWKNGEHKRFDGRCFCKQSSTMRAIEALLEKEIGEHVLTNLRSDGMTATEDELDQRMLGIVEMLSKNEGSLTGADYSAWCKTMDWANTWYVFESIDEILGWRGCCTQTHVYPGECLHVVQNRYDPPFQGDDGLPTKSREEQLEMIKIGEERRRRRIMAIVELNKSIRRKEKVDKHLLRDLGLADVKPEDAEGLSREVLLRVNTRDLGWFRTSIVDKDGEVSDLPDKCTGTSHTWHMNRYLDGMRQKGWTAATYALLDGVIYDAELEGEVYGLGDNQIVSIKSSTSNVSKDTKKFRDGMMYRSERTGMKIKETETWSSTSVIEFVKRIFIGEEEVSLYLKAASKVSRNPDEGFGSLSSEISGIFSQSATLAQLSLDPTKSYCMALVAGIRTLKSYSNGYNIDLLASLLGTSILGSLPTMTYQSFMVKSIPDNLSVVISQLKTLNKVCPSIVSFVLEIPQPTRTDGGMLVENPWSLPIRQLPSAENELKTRVKEGLKDMGTPNPLIYQFFDEDYSQAVLDFKESSAQDKSTIAISSFIYRNSVLSESDKIIGKFQASRSLQTMIASSDKDYEELSSLVDGRDSDLVSWILNSKGKMRARLFDAGTDMCPTAIAEQLRISMWDTMDLITESDMSHAITITTMEVEGLKKLGTVRIYPYIDSHGQKLRVSYRASKYTPKIKSGPLGGSGEEVRERKTNMEKLAQWLNFIGEDNMSKIVTEAMGLKEPDNSYQGFRGDTVRGRLREMISEGTPTTNARRWVTRFAEVDLSNLSEMMREAKSKGMDINVSFGYISSLCGFLCMPAILERRSYITNLNIYSKCDYCFREVTDHKLENLPQIPNMADLSPFKIDPDSYKLYPLVKQEEMSRLCSNNPIIDIGNNPGLTGFEEHGLKYNVMVSDKMSGFYPMIKRQPGVLQVVKKPKDSVGVDLTYNFVMEDSDDYEPVDQDYLTVLEPLWESSTIIVSSHLDFLASISSFLEKGLYLKESLSEALGLREGISVYPQEKSFRVVWKNGCIIGGRMSKEASKALTGTSILRSSSDILVGTSPTEGTDIICLFEASLFRKSVTSDYKLIHPPWFISNAIYMTRMNITVVYTSGSDILFLGLKSTIPSIVKTNIDTDSDTLVYLSNKSVWSSDDTRFFVKSVLPAMTYMDNPSGKVKVTREGGMRNATVPCHYLLMSSPSSFYEYEKQSFRTPHGGIDIDPKADRVVVTAYYMRNHTLTVRVIKMKEQATRSRIRHLMHGPMDYVKDTNVSTEYIY